MIWVDVVWVIRAIFYGFKFQIVDISMEIR